MSVWRITGKIIRITIMLITYYNFKFSLSFVFCVFVEVKLTVPLLCVCVHYAWKDRPRNDLCCVGWDVKPYSLTHLLSPPPSHVTIMLCLKLPLLSFCNFTFHSMLLLGNTRISLIASSFICTLV